MAPEGQHQPYDNLLKRLVENQPAAILPLLFPDLAILAIEELNVEVLIPPRRTDRVYKVTTESGEVVILHAEFESGTNSKMDKRLLIYHALLLEKYNLPIVSPFTVHPVTPPLIERMRGKRILMFEYQTLPLSQQNARIYVERHAVPFYGLLPVMENTNDELLLQAIDEMVQWYGENSALLRDELLCFRVLLERAQRLPEAEMLRVKRRIRMFDPLLEEDPWVKEKVAESEARGMALGIAEGIAEGKAKGIAEGKLQSMRELILKLIKNRFPGLSKAAEKHVLGIEQLEVLDLLIDQLMQAANEREARAALHLPPGK